MFSSLTRIYDMNNALKFMNGEVQDGGPPNPQLVNNMNNSFYNSRGSSSLNKSFMHKPRGVNSLLNLIHSNYDTGNVIPSQLQQMLNQHLLQNQSKPIRDVNTSLFLNQPKPSADQP